MKTEEFDYYLPSELIAQHPAARRDGARMLVVQRTGGVLLHRKFEDLPEYLCKGDLLVLNNTRVFPARVRGCKAGSGGKVELLLLEEKEPGVWDVLMKARRRPAPGARIVLGNGEAAAILLSDGAMGRAVVKLECSGGVLDLLEQIGEPPLPPYISRKGIPRGDLTEDRERYQTIYAREVGAGAAPQPDFISRPKCLRDLNRGV
jgi:S-adenosylmethionine:tRNA ribosyltransferase-isomerase